MDNSHFFVGVDVGGTSIKEGVVDGTGRALSSGSLATEAKKGEEHGVKRRWETVR